MLVQGRVEFKDVAPGSPAPFRARHFGIARCDVPVDMTCRADLFDEGGQVSDIKGRGENRCRMASKYRRKTLVRRDRHGTVAPDRHAVTHRN